MEDERVGSIYLRMFGKSLSGLWGSLFPRGLSRSPFLPIAVLAILVLGPAIAWRLHRLGRFHTLKTEIKGDNGADLPRPGGMDPIELNVTGDANPAVPQFLSATLLPGLGSGVLQITANLPGAGPTPLLAAPSVSDLVNGRTTPASGFNDDHGAIEFPWGGELAGNVTPVGQSITIPWQGKQIDVSTDASAHSGIAEGGLLATQSADSVSKPARGAEQVAHAFYHHVNGEDHWPSNNDVAVTALLTQSALVLTLDVKNTGTTAEPAGAGWHPRFNLSATQRRQALLQLPSGSQMQISSRSLPNGILEPTNPADRYITHPAPFGPSSIDQTIVDPKSKDAGLTFLNVDAGYGIRMTPLSSSTRALRAYSPEDANFVALGVQSNLDDPFGREWSSPVNAGMVILQPGESFQWKVKLEIFAVPKP